MTDRVRIDYISVLIGNSADEAQRWAQHNVHQLLGTEPDQQASGHGGWTVKSEYNSAVHHNQYYLRMWGHLANWWVEMSYTALRHKLITRIDVRYSLPGATRENIKTFGNAVLLRPRGRRNVQQFDSQGREKGASGRSTGGAGLAIGSHKSDCRVSVYQRGKEVPAVEIQLQGNAVDKLWAAHCGYDDAEMPWLTQLAEFKDAATYQADQWLADAAGIDLSQLDDALLNPDGAFFRESGQLSIEAVLEMYDRLGGAAQRELRTRLAGRG